MLEGNFESKRHLLAESKNSLNNGNITRFWNGKINAEMPFCEQFPIDFSICQVQEFTVKEAADRNFYLSLEEICMEISCVSEILLCAK